MDNLLKKLLSAFGVSGSEEDVRSIIKKELTNTECDVNEDKAGNLIVKLAARANANENEVAEKWMFCAHMDQVGLIATYVEDDGFIRVGKVGDIKVSESVSNFVKFKNGVRGKIGASVKNPDIKDLFIDLGMDNREMVLKSIKEGYTACLQGYNYEHKDILISPALDDRIGCYILLQMIKNITHSNKELYFVFSAEGELAGRGARAAAFSIQPDLCLVVDLEEAGNTLEGNGNINLGSGPVIKVMDGTLIMHHEIKKMLETKAKEEKIAIQYSVSSSKTDGGNIHRENGGIRTGVLAIACRYNHTVSEMVNMKDVNAAVQLLNSII